MFMVSIRIVRLRYLLLFIDSALAFIAFAQPKNSAYLDFTINRKDFVDTIPLNYRYGQILLVVAIDGKTYNLCLDTGAAMGAIYENSSISLALQDTTVTVIDSQNAKRKTRVMRLAPMQLGSLTITDYPAGLMPESVFSDCYNDGVIGFNLFRRGVSAKIDLQNKVLILTDRKDFFRKEKGITFRYKAYQTPVVTLEPSTMCRDVATFDTGFYDFYTMNKARSFDLFTQAGKDKPISIARKMREQVRWKGKGRASIGLFGVGKEDEVASLQLDRLRIGKMSFFNVPAKTGAGNSLLGCQMLEYGSIIIDPFREKLTFQPRNSSDTCRVDRRPSDFFVVPVGGKPIVSLINEQSKVYANGMRMGDTITGVDGRKMDNFCMFVAEVNAKKRTYKLSLLSEEGVKKEIVYERP